MNGLYYIISSALLVGIVAIVYLFIYQRRQSRQQTSQEFTCQYQLFDEQGKPTEESVSLATEPSFLSTEPRDSLLTSLGISDPDAGSYVEPSAPQYEPEVQTNNNKSPIVAINILAITPNQFVGYELLQAILSSGLRFGNMNIFHRYDQLNGKGKTLFSLASATEPGTFDLSDIGGFTCRGLTLFLCLDDTPNLSSNFELMLGTARQLAQDLGGELYDDQHQLLTDRIVRHYRERIRQCLQQ